MLEFGAFKDECLKKFCELKDNVSSAFLFNTFVGLPTDWHSTKKWHFDCGGNVPQIEGEEVTVLVRLIG